MVAEASEGFSTAGEVSTSRHGPIRPDDDNVFNTEEDERGVDENSEGDGALDKSIIKVHGESDNGEMEDEEDGETKIKKAPMPYAPSRKEVEAHNIVVSSLRERSRSEHASCKDE